ncbi:C25 family peptidase propeptide domain-containing protein [Candidatus Eisenbacteria bacterium]|uniref:C25 family peptidase propeptide domain-containing protein n=1 Tax=Eiseniibacteriota bacterium TaxID=2212470 RepID=A0ABV6YL30_UNCEI
MRLGFCILLSAVLLFLGTTAGAGTFVPLGSSQDASPTLVAVQLASEGPDAITIDYRLEGFELTPVSIDGETYQAVQLGKESRDLESGQPELPNIARSVIIPDDAEMAVRVVSATFQEFQGVDIVPSKGNLLRTVDPASVPYEFGPAYSQDAWFPGEVAAHREPYIMRDVRGMVVLIHPFQYNPVQKVLRVYDHVVVEVVSVGPGQTNVLQRAGGSIKIDGDFAQLYADHFLNGDATRYSPITEVGEMLVIAYDDFIPNVQPLIDWKNQMGVKTTLVAKSEVGTTSSQFQTFIQNAYDTSDLAFVPQQRRGRRRSGLLACRW